MKFLMSLQIRKIFFKKYKKKYIEIQQYLGWLLSAVQLIASDLHYLPMHSKTRNRTAEFLSVCLRDFNWELVHYLLENNLFLFLERYDYLWGYTFSLKYIF